MQIPRWMLIASARNDSQREATDWIVSQNFPKAEARRWNPFVTGSERRAEGALGL